MLLKCLYSTYDTYVCMQHINGLTENDKINLSRLILFLDLKFMQKKLLLFLLLLLLLIVGLYLCACRHEVRSDDKLTLQHCFKP